MKNKKLMAFTLAEVLITLAIIGVVAALTIPTVITNYQKKQYVTQLQKSYNNLTNGFKTYMAQEGVTRLADTRLWSLMPDDSQIWAYELLEGNNEEIKNEFLRIFKVSAIYNEDNFPGAQTIHMKNLNGNEEDDLNRGIFLADGSWLLFGFYKKPYSAECDGVDCSSLKEFQKFYETPTKFWEMAGKIYIDVNGSKGPNIIGRDLYIFHLSNDGALYPLSGEDGAVYLGCKYKELESCEYYWKNNPNYYDTGACSASTGGDGCAARIMEENWQMNY